MNADRRLALVVPLMLGLWLGCNKSKSVGPLTESSASPGAGSKQDEDQPSGQRALPPEQAFARRGIAEAPPPAAPPKSGVCAFQENGYDNADTRSEEKMVVKIKDDKI